MVHLKPDQPVDGLYACLSYHPLTNICASQTASISLQDIGNLIPCPKDLLAARSTCRTWRAYLTQQVYAGVPAGNVLSACAQPCQNAFNNNIQALARIFPNVRDLVLYVSARVSKAILNQEVQCLASAFPNMQGLKLCYLQPFRDKLDDTPSVTIMGGWLLPDTTPLTAHNPLPEGLSCLRALVRLSLSNVGAPGPTHLCLLPTTLTSLSINTAGLLGGLEGTISGLQALGRHAPLLRHLRLDAGWERAITAAGLRGLPRGLQALQLACSMDLGEQEVQALIELHQLKELALQVACQQHLQAARLLAEHPSLASLTLTLTQDQSHLGTLLGTDPPLSLHHVLRHLLLQHPGSSRGGTVPQAPAPPPAPHERDPQQAGSSRGGAVPKPAAGLASPWARLTSLALQSCSIAPPLLPALRPVPWQPAAADGPVSGSGGGSGSWGSGFLELLACLTGLQSLAIEEPMKSEGVMQGSLSQLSTLGSLRTLVVSLMAGLQVPALSMTPEAASVLSSSCPHLCSLSLLNAVHADGSGTLSFLTRFTGLHTLSLGPCPQQPTLHPPATDPPLGSSSSSSSPPLARRVACLPRSPALPVVDLHSDLPPALRSLLLQGCCIAARGLPAFRSSLRSLTLTKCELHAGDSAAGTGSCRGVGAQGPHARVERGTVLVSGTAAGAAGASAAAVDPRAERWGRVSQAGGGRGCAAALDRELGALTMGGSSSSGGSGGSSGSDSSREVGSKCYQEGEQQQQQLQPDLFECERSRIGLGVNQAATPHEPPSDPKKHVAPAVLLASFGGLRDLQFSHVVGLHDGIFPHLSTLTALTALTVLPSPQPPCELEPVAAELETGPDDCAGPLSATEGVSRSSDVGRLPTWLKRLRLSQAGLAHCSALTSLKTLSWASWSGEVSQQEPLYIQRLAEGAKGLHVLSLAPTQEPEVRARTLEVVRQLLPLCAVDEHIPL